MVQRATARLVDDERLEGCAAELITLRCVDQRCKIAAATRRKDNRFHGLRSAKRTPGSSVMQPTMRPPERRATSSA